MALKHIKDKKTFAADQEAGQAKEVEPLDADGAAADIHNIMESKGLGDSIEKATKVTGIKTMVDTISKGLNIPCGCQARKERLNKMFPYKK